MNSKRAELLDHVLKMGNRYLAKSEVRIFPLMQKKKKKSKNKATQRGD